MSHTQSNPDTDPPGPPDQDRIVITRTQIYPRPARRGRAWYWVYECTGPDGGRWDNRSITELRRLLGRRYPDAELVEQWTAA